MPRWARRAAKSLVKVLAHASHKALQEHWRIHQLSDIDHCLGCVWFWGAAHALIDWHRGSPDWHLNIYWFFLNILGCMGESIFVKTLRQLARRACREHDLRTLEES
ncbi:hypothetical protein N7465_000942 [Penicillium sp. CMV-2018d]|nr:hypothetical protein N7465_000942 [Penicillium sp. CMV-2018d]